MGAYEQICKMAQEAGIVGTEGFTHCQLLDFLDALLEALDKKKLPNV